MALKAVNTLANSPIQQWIIFDFFETVAKIPDNADRKLAGTRYDDQIAIYGHEIQRKLNEIFLWWV